MLVLPNMRLCRCRGLCACKLEGNKIVATCVVCLAESRIKISDEMKSELLLYSKDKEEHTEKGAQLNKALKEFQQKLQATA